MPGKGQIKPRWKKGQSGNPNGRPKRVFSTIIAEMKDRGIEPATPSNVSDIFQYLLALPLSDVMDIAGNPKEENDLPAIMRLAAKELLGKRGLEIMKEMLDRANGKAKSNVDVTTKGESLNEKRIMFSDGTVRDKNGNITTLPAALESSD